MLRSAASSRLSMSNKVLLPAIPFISRGQVLRKASACSSFVPSCVNRKVSLSQHFFAGPGNNIRASHSSTMTDQVRVGVGAFVLSSSQQDPQNPTFLIGKRLGSHGAGTYALPGGHLEFGESPEECAAREILEETGLEVKNVRFLTATNDILKKDKKHYITMFVVCERSSENDEALVMEPDKCEGWEWSTWEELVALVKKEREVKEGEVLERTLFQPLLDLVEQRPGVVPTL
jgi:8-oxo-dGTP diphosphatase